MTALLKPNTKSTSSLRHITRIIPSRKLVLYCAMAFALMASSEDGRDNNEIPLENTSDATAVSHKQPEKCYQAYVPADHALQDIGQDGEGSAVVNKASVVAGKPTTFEIEFTVGPSGLPVGGGVAVGIHHAALWGVVQVAAPKYRGYASASSTCPDSIELSKPKGPKGAAAQRPMFKNNTSGLNSDVMFPKLLVAKVINRPLEAGEKVLFSFGSKGQKLTAPKMEDVDNQFRVTTDADADGFYARIAQSPTFSIIPGEAHHFAGVVPAQIAQGKQYEMLIRAEDEFYNVASGFNGAVTVHDEQGKIVAKKVELINGLGHHSFSIDSLGPHRLRFSSTTSPLIGRSNPLRSFEELPAVKLYWGDIHGHTGISDGLGLNAEEYFSFGRDVGGLDVIALTDHGHWDWPANIKAVQDFHEPGKYVTLLAQEAGAMSDHMNLYFRHEDTPHIERWETDYGDFYESVFSQYNAGQEPEAITGPHHFSYQRGDDRYPYGLWDERIARFAEVYSAHGASEFPGNDRALPGATPDNSKYLQTGLARGLRFGVIGSSDNHDSHPGRTIWGTYPGGLVAFWATELSREAIWQSLWNYSVYATSMDRIYMEFSINDQGMGKDFGTTSPVTLKSYVIGKTDELTLVVIRDNEEIHSQQSTTGVIELSLQDNPEPGEHFYYLRVTQSNKERAWSTPIWVNIEAAEN